jgi:hypothetical protein
LVAAAAAAAAALVLGRLLGGRLFLLLGDARCWCYFLTGIATIASPTASRFQCLDNGGTRHHHGADSSRTTWLGTGASSSATRGIDDPNGSGDSFRFGFEQSREGKGTRGHLEKVDSDSLLFIAVVVVVAAQCCCGRRQGPCSDTGERAMNIGGFRTTTTTTTTVVTVGRMLQV